MSDSIKERLEAAVRAEPPVGDPYARFLRRRRVSRALRTMSGFVLAAITMIGVVRIFPGGTGGIPDEGLFPGQPGEPPFETYRLFQAADVGVRMYVPGEWQGVALQDTARVGPALGDGNGRPAELELRFGQVAVCDRDPCTPVGELVADPAAAQAAGLRLERATLPLGSVRVDAHRLQFPRAGDAARVGPRCPGCVGYYAELGSRRVPLLILAPNEQALAAADATLDAVLRSLVVA